LTLRADYTLMRCLYCGKELALLKRLTGGGEFCSEAHKQSYQEEYNRLGLSRLLQARSRTGESKTTQTATAPTITAAIAEPPVEEIETEEVAKAPLPPPPVIAAPPEPALPAIAGFAMETPSISLPPEPESYLELCVSDDPPLAAPAWRLESPSVEHRVFTLPSAELLPLEILPGICESGWSVMDTSAAPREVAHPRVHLSMPLAVTSSHEFEPGGSIAIAIAPRPSESSSYASLNGAIDFSHQVGVQVFGLLDLSPAGIAYPAEDCDVTLPDSWTNGITSEAPVDITVPAIAQDSPDPGLPAEPTAAEKPKATPRAALEALSRLHKDMRAREEAKPADSRSEAEIANAPEAAPTPVEEPAEEAPPEVSELLAISVKSFAPPKASPSVDTNALVTNGQPLLPRLKGLPLRPKVAPAPRGFGKQPKAAPPPSTPSQPKAQAGPTTPSKIEVQPKPPAADKAAKPPQVSKTAQSGESKKPAVEVKSKQPAPAIPAAPAAQSPAQPKQATKPVNPEQPDQAAPADATGKSAPAAPKTQPFPTKKPETAAATSSPTKEEPAQKAPVAKGQSISKAAPAPSTDNTVPNFGAVVNTSMFGSMKVKIGIAALAAVIGIGAYFVYAGKSGKPSASPTKSTDGVGMSIMVGEGGWVEGWAGDPIGLHTGRQITIYRPSLKLSDYRFDFQGQIDTKSLGWIFRAADPENYYAMKLELVSPELPLTVVLYKYMVLKGRQVQVGRVPIELPVKNDTVFSVRLDVRGPKFSAYVQGQPVDVWTDDQLRTGGVGFLNERNERGKVKSVSLSYLPGGTK
jgi:hypothetical protein